MILIAEDSPLNMMLIVSMVNQLMPEAEVIEVTNGRQAVDVLDRIIVDLVFMDIQMPEMDGLTATRVIRKQEAAYGIEKPVPIVAVTAYTLNHDKEKCLDAGMNDFLSKPIVKDDINDILVKYLDTDGQQKNEPVISDLSGFDNRHFDMVALAERTAFEKGVLKELAKNAAKDLNLHLQHLSDAITQNKLSDIKYAAHTIKGTALNISFNSLAGMARNMELLSEENPENMRQHYQLMVSELETIQNLLAEK